MKATINKSLLIILTVFLVCNSCSKDDVEEPENNKPVLSTIQDPAIGCSPYRGCTIIAHLGEITQIELSATDEDGDSLTFSITNNPGFLSITDFSQTGNTATAILAMDPDMSLRERQNATVQVSDGKGGVDSQSFEISFSFSMVRLYVCGEGLRVSTVGSQSGICTENSYTISFGNYYLTNDLVGTEYSFHLRCSCTSTREFTAYIKIGGKKVAEAKFDVSGETERYDIYVEGEDPDITGETEVELYVVINGSGAQSCFIWSPWNDFESYIHLPPMDKN